MHIVHLETGRHLYGGARQVLLLMQGLAAKGVRNTLVCPPDSAIATAADPAHAEVHTIPMAGELDAFFGRRLGRGLLTAHADLLHVHSRRGADVWGWLAARRADVPAVLTRRVDNPGLPLLGHIKYRMYDKVIAISEQVKNQLIADGVPEDSVTVIYSAIDADSCAARWSRAQFLDAFGLASDDLVVICAAQFIARKGHEDLIGAWADVIDACPRARLLLFGQGPNEADLRALVQRRGLIDSVQFPGFRQDLRDFLGCADALVHPAKQEGLGIVLLEAQAAGLPVVTVDAGGMAEAVAADQTALVVNPNSTAELGAAVIRLLEDAGLREALGAAGAARVRQHFAPEKMVNGYLEVYKKMLGETH